MEWSFHFVNFKNVLLRLAMKKKVVVGYKKNLSQKMYWMAAYDDYDKNFLF